MSEPKTTKKQAASNAYALTFWRGLRDGIPIGVGYLSVAFSFGILAAGKGLPVWMAVFISMTNLTSAGQLAGVEILLGGTYLEMILTQTVINIRYALMSLTLSQKLDANCRLPDRLLIAAGITDEIFAVSVSKPGSIGKHYMAGLIAIPYIGWAVGTLLGAVAGSLLPDVLRSALGIALYGMFIAIILPPARENHGILTSILAAAALACAIRYLPFLSGIPTGFAVIFAALLAALLAAFFFPVSTLQDEKEVQGER